MTIRIAELEKKDRPALQNLFLKFRQTTFSWPDTTTYELSSFDKETEGEYILVAHLDNIVAGFISVWLPDSFIHHLYIENKYQGQGVGAKLLRAAIKKLTLPVRLKCLQKNKTAIDFYKKHGFIQKEEGVSDEGVYILFEYAGNR